jgi:hypothetical protein
VKDSAQWYLVEMIYRARGRFDVSDSHQTRRDQLSHFAGILAAFRYMGDLTQDEEHDWGNRMRTALGFEVYDVGPPGPSRAVYEGDPANGPDQQPPERDPEFVRSMPGPDREFDVHGGRIRIIAWDFYDSVLAVRWRVSPHPDVTSVFPDEADALELDLVGLEDWAAEDLRRKGHEELLWMRLYRFALNDDVGTPYISQGPNFRGNDSGASGEVRFQAPPSEASQLTFTWLNLDISIPIT